MQRTILLLILAMGLVAAAPLTAAQSQFSTTTVEVAIAGPTEPVPAGGQVSLPGKLTYTYPGTGQMEMSGTPVTFKVAEAPEWATVVVNPTSLVIPVSGQRAEQVVEKTEKFIVQIHVEDSAPVGESAVVTIQAIAQHNGNLNGATGTSSILLATPSGDPCTAASSSEDVTVQGVTAEPVGIPGLAPAQMAAVLGIGAAAGVAGLVIGRRSGSA